MIIVQCLRSFLYGNGIYLSSEHWFFSFDKVLAWDGKIDQHNLDIHESWFMPDIWQDYEVSILLDSVQRDTCRRLAQHNETVYQHLWPEPWKWVYATFVRPSPDYEHLKTLTCWNCPFVSSCHSVWDSYNTDGDCLELK